MSMADDWDNYDDDWDNGSEPVTLTLEVHGKTEKAIKVKIEDRFIWLPKSQISMHKVQRNIFEIDIPEWLLESNDL